MSDDSDYVEGDAGSAPADAPGVVPADDTGPRDAKQGGIDSSSTHDAPVLQKQRATARTQQARKAFAEAILASKKAAADKPPTEADELDPEAPPTAAAKPAELAATKDAAAAKAVSAEAAPAATEIAKAVAAAPAAAPAPSLDPEVRQLTAYLKAEREKLDAERGEWEKQRKAAEPAAAVEPDTHSLEAYIDSPPAAYRNWLESMRGEKFATDDEFKSEVSDFITMLSSDVLGVPLPENVRVKLDAAQAKKFVRTHKTIQARREAETAAKAERERATAAEKAEIDRMEREWDKAKTVISDQFLPKLDVEGKPQASDAARAYRWLARTKTPGHHIIDVIRSVEKNDGTQLSWQEAAKRANDWLAEQGQAYYEEHKDLFKPDAPTTTPAATKPAEAAKPAPPVVTPPARSPTAPQSPNKWSRDRHVENTKAAFRAMIAAKQE